MRPALARASVVDRPSRVPVQPRPDDRWALSGSTGSRSAVLLVVLAGSLLAHVLFVGSLLAIGGAPPPPPPTEIPIELVQDAPPPKPAPTPEAKPARKPVETAKLEPPKPPAPPKPVAAAPPQPTAPIKPPADANEIAALQKELADLKAEHDALASRAAAAEPPAADPGRLLGGFQAIAMPDATAAGGDGELAGYQEIVFSELAKAKGIGRKQGRPGTAGVHFVIDDAGRLVSAEIVAPSGIAALDAEALAIVHRAAPFPAPPKGAQRDFVANVNFVPQADP